MNRLTHLSPSVLVLLLLTAPAVADVCVFGYSDTAFAPSDATGTIVEIFDTFGLSPNVGVIIAANQSASVTASVAALNARGARGIVSIPDVVFEHGITGLDCDDYGGGEPTGGVGSRLYTDWQTRLDAFLSLNSSVLDAAYVAALLIHGEANNACVPVADLDDVATHIKKGSPYRLGDELPVIVGFPMTIRAGAQANPLPAAFPNVVDVIATWDYGIFNPNNDAHPYNYTNNWSSRWAAFETKLGSRDAMIVLNAFCDSGHVAMGWVGACTGAGTWPIAVISDRWREWAQAEPAVVGILPFLWRSPNYPTFVGTRDLDPVVRQSHQITIDEIDCTYNP